MMGELVKEQLPEISEQNILCEPIGKNTAPGIGLAAVHIGKKYEDATMIILPSDHLIKYNTMFTSTLKDAFEVAEHENNLVTIGITPDYPETGYNVYGIMRRKSVADYGNVEHIKKSGGYVQGFRWTIRICR